MIGDLNAIPPTVLDEARLLQGEEQYNFLWERVTPVNRGFLRLFIRDVVTGGADADSWGRGKVLLPDLSLARLLASSAAEIATSLGPPGDTGWFSVEGHTVQDVPDPYVGAPAAVRPDLPYLWRPPRGVTAKTMRMAERLRSVSQIEPTIRRWMAYRTRLAVNFRWERLTNPESIAELADVDISGISTDGMMALEALATEARNRRSW